MEIFIPKDCARRLLQDVKQLMKNPLHEHGIYYKHDEENFLRGYALIVGGEDTPYFGGYYFFTFHFSSKYPYEPPKVDYCTNDGKTRFNPNLYTNKKTCLSVLNTWKGEQWSSCQTISTVLLSLSTVLCANPILNEPHVTQSHRDFENYNSAIEYKNIEVAVCAIILKNPNIYYDFFHQFEEYILEHFNKNVDKLIKFCQEKEQFEKVVHVSIYHMSTKINYKRLCNLLQSCKETYDSETVQSEAESLFKNPSSPSES
jgi:ubiquitin-conjugating enzyme E2 Z